MDRSKLICNFLGSYEISLDPKNRVSIPSKWRNNIGREVVMFKSPDNILSMTSREIFVEMCSDLANKSLFDRNVRIVRRNFLGSACEIELDKWNRFVIPSNLFKENGLKKDLILVGNGDFIEILVKDKHDSLLGDEESSYEKASQAISGI